VSKVETEHIFSSGIHETFEGIRQYDQYPEYLPGISKLIVLPAKKKNSTCQVRYEINLIKQFYYVIDMFEESPQKIWWNLAESNLMKMNNGEWQLSETNENQTHATYNLEVKFKGLVPSAVTNKVIQANLMATLNGFQSLIDDHQKN